MVDYESEVLMIGCRSHDGQVKNSMPYYYCMWSLVRHDASTVQLFALPTLLAAHQSANWIKAPRCKQSDQLCGCTGKRHMSTAQDEYSPD